jgi:hypothetical protein
MSLLANQDDEEVCPACSNGDDVLHVPEHPKYSQNGIGLDHPSLYYHHSSHANINSSGNSPREEFIGSGMNSLNRQYSVPGWSSHNIGLGDNNPLGLGSNDEPHSFMEAF